MDLYIIITTTKDKKSAKALAKALLESNLIACAQWHKITSYYRYKDKLHCHKEYLLTLKTTATKLESAKALLIAKHSYEVPECVIIKVDSSTQEYADFVRESTTSLLNIR